MKCGNTHFWRFSVIWEIEHVVHISRLLLHHRIPALLRDMFQGLSQRGMILLPTHPLKDRVRFRQRLELKLRRLDPAGQMSQETSDTE